MGSQKKRRASPGQADWRRQIADRKAEKSAFSFSVIVILLLPDDLWFSHADILEDKALTGPKRDVLSGTETNYDFRAKIMYFCLLQYTPSL